jgi:acetyltransferase
MTIRNLDALFEPQAIALIGASNQVGSVGSVLAHNLMNAGFAGPILPVNPHETAIGSALNYTSIGALPVTPDLAVIATPPKPVPGLVAELAARGTRAAVIITAGFGEGGSGEGAALRQAVLDAARPCLMRIIGPNCLGFISPGRGINASFAHLTPKAGSVAFVTQSGALATAILDWAKGRDFGFSHVISLGDMADVDFGDLLDYLALDPATSAILLYVESIAHARKFMSAARIAARAKPVIVIKSGSSSAGAKAALSHTGALAGADLVYDAAFRRAGMLRVHALRELFEAVATLSAGVKVGGDRLAVLTNGGGAGVLTADALEERGGRLAALSAEAVAKLDAVLPPTWSHGNPVDILGDAHGERYAAAMQVLLGEKDTDAILVLNCPTAVANSTEVAATLIQSLPEKRRLGVLTCWLGDPAAQEGRHLFTAAHVPTYETPDEAVRAFMQLVEYGRNQTALLETPPANRRPIGAEARAAVRAIIDAAIGEKRALLNEVEAKAVLGAYGIPTVDTRTAVTPQEAAKVAREMKRRVVLKILSPDITHKSDAGGVRLDLDTPEAVERAANEMLATVKQRVPNARITGFVVEEMIVRPHAHELLLGIGDDGVFGPILLFGQGGTAAEVIRDRAIALPPLNRPLALGLIARTRIAALLKGYRDRPPVDLDKVADTLVALSELIVDFPEVAELDINPLLADDKGVVALDARVVVRPAEKRDRMAIRPYPRELEHEATLPGGETYVVRPIRPEDEPALVRMLDKSSLDDLRARFPAAARNIPHLMAARLSQIDYDREMALAAVSQEGEIHGVSRLVADPDNVQAEFGLMVRTDKTGRGLGTRLLGDLIDYAELHGLAWLAAEAANPRPAMLELAHDFGFRVEALGDGRVRMTRALKRT